MRLKASHWWLTDGAIVVEVRDHDAYSTAPLKDTFFNKYIRHNRTSKRASIVSSATYPRGTTKDEVKLIKKAMIMAHEIKVNEVSR